MKAIPETATASSWHRLFDLNAAWCRLKIILASIGHFLVIDLLGTILAIELSPLGRPGFYTAGRIVSWAVAWRLLFGQSLVLIPLVSPHSFAGQDFGRSFNTRTAPAANRTVL
jgi:hypothetical protein